MANKKGGLGKGLEALFADNAVDENTQAVTLKLTEIEPNAQQPRKHFDPEKLNELASSIAEHGILQPILVSPLANGRYQLIAGERRWRAARIARLDEVPVVIRDLTEKEKKEIALIENLQREDLNPIETAQGIQVLIDEYGLTQDQAAQRVGCSRPAVANALRLLNLPPSVIELTRLGKISAGHARALLAFKDDETIEEMAREIIEKDLSVRALEKMAKTSEKKSQKRVQKAARRDSYYDEVEIALSETLGRRVRVVTGVGKGTLEIEFYDKEDLKALANSFKGD